jgi:hypothetical protein
MTSIWCSTKDYLMLNDFDVTLAKNGMEGFEKFKRCL